MRWASVWLVLLTAWPAGAEEWKLVWGDEFDKPGPPDQAKWDYEVGFIRNNEQQFYTKGRTENARVEEGVLVIEARKEKWKNPGFDPSARRGDRRRRGVEFADYTSASLITRGKAAWKYGRIEVRAKVPAGRGTWPAIWMLGTNMREVGWPACGEIDIMEHVGFEPGVVHANVHTRKYNHVRGTAKGDKITVKDAAEAFHVYSVEWDEKRLEFFLDGRKYFTFENEGSGADAWPFDREQYLILNLAIGGDWGGRKGIDEATFPQRYLVDYVRVYQKGAAAGAKAARPVMVSAKQWGSKPQAMEEGRKQTAKFVTVHHAGEVWKEGTDPVKKIQGLQAWGQREKKWPDVPYHFLIAADGRIFEGRDVRYEPDSNTKYELAGNIGVMLWGNFGEQRVSKEQLESAVKLTGWLCSEHGIDPKTVRTHKDVAQTACPGRDLYRYFEDGQFQRWAAEAMNGESPDVELREPLKDGPTQVIAGADKAVQQERRKEAEKG